jgi:hypothetical protein
MGDARWVSIQEGMASGWGWIVGKGEWKSPTECFILIPPLKNGVSLKENELGIDPWELWLFRFIGWNLS